MSHEEKALRNNYGSNFDGQLTAQQTALPSPLKVRRGPGSKLQKSAGRSTARADGSGRKAATAFGQYANQVMSRNVQSSTQLRHLGGGDLGQGGPYNTYGGSPSQQGSQERFAYQ